MDIHEIAGDKYINVDKQLLIYATYKTITILLPYINITYFTNPLTILIPLIPWVVSKQTTNKTSQV
jgi:hypothetical protein